jgi:uncharacterized membrane protein
MTKHDWALLLHLIGVVLLFSGMSVAAVADEAARRRERPSEIAALLGPARVGVVFVAAGTVCILAGGFWLVGSIGAYSLGDGWISASLALLVAAFVVGGLGGQRPKGARLLASRLAREGDAPSEELRTLLDDPLSRAANYVAAIAVIAALAIMVWKPGT